MVVSACGSLLASANTQRQTFRVPREQRNVRRSDEWAVAQSHPVAKVVLPPRPKLVNVEGTTAVLIHGLDNLLDLPRLRRCDGIQTHLFSFAVSAQQSTDRPIS